MRNITHKDGTVSEVEEVSFSDGAKVTIQYCAETSQWQFSIPNASKQMILQYLRLPSAGNEVLACFEPRANS